MSRKYGVINVFSSGNGEWNPKTLNEWINERKLAFNSIIVGALNDSNTNISYYSNWRVYEKYEDISKPFVLAPGTYSYYNNKLLNELGHWRTEYKVNKDIYVNGISFSAPAVSGAISLFLSLEENNKINNDKDRVQSIKSIIAASSTELKIGKTKQWFWFKIRFRNS
ncbi:S8 family serine peptidase [Mycoplasmopsis felis]|nr:S8 family serine peptidase [Mycoplasmopsis felis]MCU9934717.1 S8 family serine peptidase [Mycoplasmopsis felis]